ncbi:MAG: biotin/lipoyl-binding protein [Alphaproteobacteria bacterium]
MNEKSDLLRSLQIERDASDGATSSRVSWVVPAGIGVAGLVVGAVVGWFVKPAPPPPPPSAEASTPALGAKPVAAGSLVASGYAVARRQATVAAEVTGRPVEVRVEEGQKVKRGEILAVLEPTLAEADFKASAPARQRRSDLAEAQRVLERTRTIHAQGFASNAT